MATTGQKVAAGTGLGAVVALALTVATPLVGRFEGERLDPYKDIVNRWTVCDGETNVAMRHYTKTQCAVMLQKSIASRAAPIVQCVPQLGRKPYQLAASMSLAYNIGTGAFCRSWPAEFFRQGNDRAACVAFGRYVFAGGREVTGLVRRRSAERGLCEKGL